MHPGMQIAPQDQSFGNGYEMQSFPLPNMSTTAINPLQQTGGNDRGMHSRLQGPSQGQTFGSGYDMHSFPLHEMSAASVKEPLHELEGSALAGYIPTSLVVHKANTASRTRSAGGNRIQAQANTDYTQMFDEENAEYKKRGEVPLQSDILSGGTILKAQRGIGNSMVVNQSSSYRQDNKIATKEAAKTETAKEPAKMPEKPSRPMTYKEDYERRCRAASEARRLKEIERMQAEAMALEISNLEAVRVEQATNQAARFQIPPAQGQFSAPVLFPGFGQEPRQPQGFLSVPRPMFPRQDYMPTRTDRLLGTLAPINTSGPAVDSSVSLPVSPVHRARSGLDEVVSKLPRHVVTRVASQNTLQANSTSPSLFYQREELAARLQNAANNYTQRSRKGDGGASQAQIRS
ncbi:uncharacterized protein LY89DRAFT_682875 [Mollisia scopiformis]|uniref:Uncharacterized protein n=1 Tax=Mollisia scopiformis TaxID=149040 RepID=A0A194XIY6_MOLSC|nr:uncharacterized protein LY89DRAFT_682875 [Mollisia scopiformis]KUJ20079.1 hypothetical protein LY89DRAFT_682875 [Mollisia scopiformis]